MLGCPAGGGSRTIPFPALNLDVGPADLAAGEQIEVDGSRHSSIPGVVQVNVAAGVISGEKTVGIGRIAGGGFEIDHRIESI